MITAHYSIWEWGLVLHYVINSFIFQLLKIQTYSFKFSKSCSLSAQIFHSFLISEGYFCSSL